MATPLILVTNDDGITSRGIRKLVELVATVGEVVVLAPDSPQSGMGHAITVGDPLRIRRNDIFGDIVAYECTGTPADCVKLAKHHVFKDRKIDLVVSGVNHGSNSSISILYSGTMSAAIEAAIENVPAIGFSLCDFNPDADMSHIDEYVLKVVHETLEKGIPEGVALNVNFPPIQNEKIKGIKVCRQANANWEEQFDERKDPYGRNYFWMVGNFVSRDRGEDNDESALANNYVSIVPSQFDLTAYNAIRQLNEDWEM
ncbi:MAG: 5'/3'-nucleotidase SurE [Bacteroidota bacterium]